ncbi:MAG: hypothetical protein B7Z16_02400 [Algoriphagus sp. 32-45-6]|nr:MAG: hypothetical protein B7Z16_02400 [Algoriphagus sp. 32-45-6]
MVVVKMKKSSTSVRKDITLEVLKEKFEKTAFFSHLWPVSEQKVCKIVHIVTLNWFCNRKMKVFYQLKKN